MDSYLYVGNLPFDVTEQMLTDTFQKIGNVVEVKLAKSGGFFQGFGFVRFENAGYVTKAIEDLQAVQFNGRESYLEPAAREADLWDDVFSSVAK